MGLGSLVESLSGKHTYQIKWYVIAVTIIVHIGMALKIMIWRVLFNIPLIRRPFITFMRNSKTKSKRIPEEDFVNSMATFKSWIGLSRSACIDALKTVRPGGPMKDVDLFRLDKTPCRLSDFMKSGRPLAINFGSCT
jgi:hypothetical protein